MVGGVAGTVISAVALSFTLNAFIEQNKIGHAQADVVAQQQATLSRIESELIQIRKALTTPPNPSQATPP